MEEIEKLIHTSEGKLKHDKLWCLVVGARARITDDPSVTGLFFRKGSVLTVDAASIEDNTYYVRFAKQHNRKGPETVVGSLNTEDSYNNHYKVADYGKTMRIGVPFKYLEPLEE